MKTGPIIHRTRASSQLSERTAKELAELGQTFEKEEQRQFGPDGFKSVVAVLSDVEKHLGIYDLSSSTPKL